MKQKLILFLGSDQAGYEPSWLADGILHHGDIAALPVAAKHSEVIVLVPAQDVLLATVKLPKMSHARLLQAIPFALEEQLIAEVSALHFAIGEIQEEGCVPVAIVAKAKMQAWLALLATWQIKPTILIPATFALPDSKESWYALIAETVWVRTGTYSGFACNGKNFVNFMQAALSEATTPPQQLVLQNYTNHAYSGLLDNRLGINEEFLDAATMQDNLLSGLPAKFPINLLQREFATRQARLPVLQVRFRWAAYFAAAWLILLLFTPAISSFILGGKVRKINQEIAMIYQRHFPQSTSVVAPKQRLQEKLQKTSADINENQLLLSLAYLGKAMTVSENIKLKQLDYQNHQLMIELSAIKLEDLSAFMHYLMQQGLAVKQQNADLFDGSRVNATLVIG